MEGVVTLKKRMRIADGSEEAAGARDEAAVDEEEAETALVGSDEMEMQIQRILERIDRFTQQVSEMLEAGKTMFAELSSQFEERLINIHREQMEKWQDEIKELRVVDASNESTRALLQNAQHHFLSNVGENS